MQALFLKNKVIFTHSLTFHCHEDSITLLYDGMKVTVSYWFVTIRKTLDIIWRAESEANLAQLSSSVKSQYLGTISGEHTCSGILDIDSSCIVR